MDVKDFISRIDSLILNLETEVEDILLRLAVNAKASIQMRLQEKGIDAYGKPLKPYSEAYLKYKKKKGKYTGKVDMTFTGGMLRSTGIIKKEKKNKEVAVFLGGRDRESQIKLNVNSAARGDLLKLSKSEIEYLQSDFDEEIISLVKRYINE